MTDESHITRLTQEAESCLDKGELAQARQLYADICRAHDNDAQAWLMFGAINGQMGNVEVAQSALERAVALDSHNAEAHLALAHLLKGKGQLADGLASASRAVQADTDFVDGWLFLAAAAGQLGNWPSAKEACNKALALAPERAEVHVNLGNVLLTTGSAQEAEESYRKALTLSETAEAWFGLGTALDAQGRHADAEPALTAALRLKTDNTVFRDALARCLERLGRSDESAAVRGGLH